jgi:hypothetical protein
VNGIIVDKASIQDVVNMIQAATAAASSSTPFSQPDEILKENLSQMTLDDEVENIDVSQYLKVVDAFSMPSMQYDYHRKGFVQYVEDYFYIKWWLRKLTVSLLPGPQKSHLCFPLPMQKATYTEIASISFDSESCAMTAFCHHHFKLSIVTPISR